MSDTYNDGLARSWGNFARRPVERPVRTSGTSDYRRLDSMNANLTVPVRGRDRTIDRPKTIPARTGSIDPKQTQGSGKPYFGPEVI